MAMLMAIMDMRYCIAYDFESAVCKAASFVPNIALLDLSRPEPDGMELARRFQQMTQTKKTVLIAY